MAFLLSFRHPLRLQRKTIAVDTSLWACQQADNLTYHVDQIRSRP